MGKILLQESSDHIELLHENDASGKKQLYIEGIFAQSEVINKNNRLYKHDLLENAIDKYIQEFVNERRALGELTHPQGRPFADAKMGAILTKSLSWDGDNVVGKALVLNTDEGRNVAGLLEGGFNMGVSTRGLGSVAENQGVNLVTDYMLTAIDCVDNPSGPNCFVNAIVESATQWTINEQGVWVPLINEELNNDDKLQLYEDRFKNLLKGLKRYK